MLRCTGDVVTLTPLNALRLSFAVTLLSLSAFFLLGIFLGETLDVAPPVLALFAVASILTVALSVTLGRTPKPALLSLVLVLGALRAGPPEVVAALAAYQDRPIAVDGVVTSDPEAAGLAIKFRLRVERVRPGEEWVQVLDDVLVTLEAPAELIRERERPSVRYGDRLLLEGALQAPPELKDFDYPAYLARQGITYVMYFPGVTLVGEDEGSFFYGGLSRVRRSFARSLEMVVPEPQAAVGQALLLGMRDNLPDDLVEKFRVTGTSHLLAISGLHVGILLGLSLAASQWALGRRRQIYLIAPLILVWMYALIAGMSPSVTRAALMGSVYLAAYAVGRPKSILPALGLAAAIMVAAHPNILWRVSFQLSFAAIAGIALFAEPLRDRIRALYESRLPDGAVSAALGALSIATAMTVATTLATLPLAAFYFGRIALAGLPATVLSLPALPLVLTAHALAGGVGLVSSFVALPFGWLAWVATAYITGLVSLFAQLPGASFETGNFGPPLVWAYYGGFAIWYGARSLRLVGGFRELALRSVGDTELRVPQRAVPWWALAVAGAVAALVWIAALSLPDGRLHVTFADVGQGDAVLITTPRGQHILVDGGPDPVLVAGLVGNVLPFWDRDIELAVLTHPHADHVAGLTEVLRRYNVANILERDTQYDKPSYAAWRQAVAEEGAAVTRASAGQVIATSDGVLLQVLSPTETLLRKTASDVDNASVVLRLVYGDVSFLLTGDIFSEAESAMLARNAQVQSTVLKVAHHGSRSSSSEEFLRRVAPAAAVVSAGEDNRYGHPHPEAMQILARLMRMDRVFVTKDDGDIEFVTDGKRLTVRMGR